MALESSSEWIESVRELCTNHVDRLELQIVDFERPETIAPHVSGPFDVVVIDNEGPRTPLVPIATQLVGDGGLIILDNADRDEYAEAIVQLEAAGFSRLDFFGLVPINAFASVTALFTKSQIPINGGRATFTTVDY